MLIDFHTHIFPDKIAERTICILRDAIKKESGFDVVPLYNGTVSGLDSAMTDEGVDMSVIMPISTKESQTDNIIKFAKTLRNERMYSFASLYPYQSDRLKVLERIKGMGFAGIKLHPEYQQLDIDSKDGIELLTEAERLGLYVMLHTGADGGYPPPYHCVPRQLANALKYVSGKYIIAGHMGGFMMWDDVEKYLVGTDIYMDTAMLCGYIDPVQAKRIIVNHGADKILFGSDMPWNSPRNTEKMIDSMNLGSYASDRIKYKNALEILSKAENAAKEE